MNRDRLPPLSTEELKKAGHNYRPLWIAPVLDKDIQGEIKEWKEKNRIQSVRVPGYWCGHWSEQVLNSTVERAPPPGGKVIIYFHGGDYVVSKQILYNSFVAN